MSNLADPIETGISRGWKVFGEGFKPMPASYVADVVIVGSGAGAGITSAYLTLAGLSVVIIEEGPLRSSKDFRQLESDAYPQLYQESASRKTADKAINILQGRAVGGGTLINWTSTLRANDKVFDYWVQKFGLTGFSAIEISKWYSVAEKQLRMQEWKVLPNSNNGLLAKGMEKLGYSVHHTTRNVDGCFNLGSCGLGCPTNAKQSALLNTIAPALERGAALVVQTRVDKFIIENGTVLGVECVPVTLNSSRAAGSAFQVRAKHFVLSAGAINSPALLMRSKAPDPHSVLGKRTMLHPNIISLALYDEKVEGWAGAPQTIYSHQFSNYEQISGPIGYKLDVAPLHPVLGLTTVSGLGKDFGQILTQFPNSQPMLSLLRDGFHEESAGGTVRLGGDGTALLDYPLTPYMWEGVRRAYLTMAEIQFAAGAKSVMPVHEQATFSTSWSVARHAIEELSLEPYKTRIASAHQMGGCSLSSTPERGVVNPLGVHWQLKNLSVHDGSLFPTGLGTNPQLTIYAVCSKLAAGLAKSLSGHDIHL